MFNKIVDKHSGYLIKVRNYDMNEGYDKDGYKINTKEVLEEDDAVRFLVLAASSGEKPGPLVSLLAGQKSGKLPVPIVIVPQDLSDEAIDDLASRAE